MGIREKFLGWFGRKPAAQTRAGGPPFPWEPTFASSFGPGISNQPTHQLLLQESLGIAAAATRKIADRMSTLKPLVKEMEFVNGKEVPVAIQGHPLVDLFRHPHPNFTMRMLLRLITQWVATTGDAYLHKVATNPVFPDLPTRLDPISPTMVTPLVSLGVIIGFRVTHSNGRQEDRPASEFVRFYFPDPENPWGSEGLLGPMSIEVDSNKFAHSHLRAHYQHDATPKTTLESTEDATAFSPEERERFQTEWMQHYNQRTGDKLGLPSILPTGYKLVQLGLQTGADLTPLLEHWRDDILMNWGVPRSVLGQVISGDRSSAETNEWVFEKHTIQPFANMEADGFTMYLASDFDARDVFVEFDEFITADKAHRLAQEQSDLDRKVKSINEVREDRGLTPVEWGDEPERPNESEEDEERASSLAAEERAAHIRIRQEFRERKRRTAQDNQGSTTVAA